MKNLIGLILVIGFALTACEDSSTDSGYVWNPEARNEEQEEPTDQVNKYTVYPTSPNAIKAGDLIHLYYTDTPGDDYSGAIHYALLNSTGDTLTSIKNVLRPSEDGWDNEYVGDPMVLKGPDISYDGHTYTCVMFYTGSDESNYYNQIGIAFADSLDAEEWVKYEQPLIEKPWSEEGDLIVDNKVAYGVGQPASSTVGSGGRFLLLYTLEDEKGIRVIKRDIMMADMSNINLEFNPPGVVSTGGLMRTDGSSFDYLANVDYAWDFTGSNMFYMIRPVHSVEQNAPGVVTTELELVKLEGASFWANSGTWSVVGTILQDITGKEYNHSPALLRVRWGGIDPSLGFTIFHLTSTALVEDISQTMSDEYYSQWDYTMVKTTLP